MPVPHVVSVIEYFQHYDDWTVDERHEAKNLLEGFRCDISHGSIVQLQARYYGPRDHWRYACIRCGQVVNAKTKRIRGLGKNCYNVVGKGPIRSSGRRIGPPVEAELIDASPLINWKEAGRP
jgi:hypothetical protein